MERLQICSDLGRYSAHIGECLARAGAMEQEGIELEGIFADALGSLKGKRSIGSRPASKELASTLAILAGAAMELSRRVARKAGVPT